MSSDREGGFRIRRLEEFNKAFLFKWRLRILEDSNSLWLCMLKVSYVDVKLGVVTGEENIVKKSSRSVWWSDISSLGKYLLEELLAKSFKFRVDLGVSTSFWHVNWLELGILKEFFSGFVFLISFAGCIYSLHGRVDKRGMEMSRLWNLQLDCFGLFIDCGQSSTTTVCGCSYI